METTVTKETGIDKKEDFKVIPVREATRERLKNDMMKRDTYDSYINDTLDENISLKKQIAELMKHSSEVTTKRE